VAVPRIVSNDRFDRPGGPSAVLGLLRRDVEVPIILENNVNCAAIGEMHFGAAQGHQTFAFLQVGVRVGLGFITEGRLFRGAGGAAGEIGRMPFPWSANETPYREGLEHYLGSRALIERCRVDWPAGEGAPPDSAKDLFARALEGSPPAVAAVARHGADIGRLAAGCIGMLDPGLIVLGGGVAVGGGERLLRAILSGAQARREQAEIRCAHDAAREQYRFALREILSKSVGKQSA